MSFQFVKMYFFIFYALLFNKVFCLLVQRKETYVTPDHFSFRPMRSLIRRKRLTGGIEAQPREVSMVGSLQRKADRQHFCGATLITLKHGITGCSCVLIGLPTEAGLLELSNFVVVAGDKRLNTTINSRLRDVQSFRKDERCKIDEETGIWQYGLGYFQLTKAFPDHRGPTFVSEMHKSQKEYNVALKRFYDNDEYTQGSRTKYCFTYGWGAKRYNPKTGDSSLFPYILNKRALQFISLKECQDRLCNRGFCSFKIDQAGAICLGVPDNKDGGICKGDAGNPLMCGNKFFGVAEEMPDCGMSLKFAIFYKLDIRYLQKFIKSGSPVPCLFSVTKCTHWIIIIPIFYLYMM